MSRLLSPASCKDAILGTQTEEKELWSLFCAASIRTSHANPCQEFPATELISPPLLTASHASHSPTIAAASAHPFAKDQHTQTETGDTQRAGSTVRLALISYYSTVYAANAFANDRSGCCYCYPSLSVHTYSP